jgi:histidinol dehydrogenase
MRLRFLGSWSSLTDADRDALLRRSVSRSPGVTEAARKIVADVRRRGDAALRESALRFDNARLETLEVPREAMRDALDRTDPALLAAMRRSARNIACVHRAFLPREERAEPEPGILICRRPDPLDRVGVYAPGGRAAYASTVLMTVIPACIAGVREVIVASPPGRDGLPSRSVLAAAALAGAHRVFAIGGAGAIAAMAYGTESVPRVERIVGPGNAWVTAAKLMVVGDVAIDSPAGPSELAVIADDSTDLDMVAAEMVAQAEHDPDACVVAFVADGCAMSLRDALARSVRAARRGEVVRAALATSGAIIEVSDLDEAVVAANAYAPEHLLLACDAAEVLLPHVRNAGAVFVGASASVTFGDYMSGANHVLPTGGARGYSGLSPLDFVRFTSWQRVTPEAAHSMAADVATFARAEALDAHAAAASRWELSA